MTEPTWKDPLLEEWSHECSDDTDDYIRSMNRETGPLNMLTFLVRASGGVYTEDISDDADRLRSLIAAELTRGRRAKARAAAIIAEYAPAIEPESYDDGRIDAAREILEAFDGE